MALIQIVPNFSLADEPRKKTFRNIEDLDVELRQYSMGTYEYESDYGTFYFNPKLEPNFDSFSFRVKFIPGFRPDFQALDCEAIESDSERGSACLIEVLARSQPN